MKLTVKELDDFGLTKIKKGAAALTKNTGKKMTAAMAVLFQTIAKNINM